MTEQKFLCKLKWKEYIDTGEDDDYYEKHTKISEMTIEDINIFLDIYEKADVEILIPMKTSNLPEKEGSVRDLTEVNNEVQANGENPEVDNPVGQVKNLFKLYNLNPDDYIHARLIEDLILLLNNINKPRETDKKEPFFSDNELKIIMDSCNNWVDTLGVNFPTGIQPRHKITAKIRKYLNSKNGL